MSVRYICTQCETIFIVGDGAGSAVNCLACGGMAFPAADEGNDAEEESSAPDAARGVARAPDIHDEETDILPTSDDPYRERTEVLPARNIVPNEDESEQAFVEDTSAKGRLASDFDDFSSLPSEDSESFSHPHPDEQSAPNLAGPALPSSLWGTEQQVLYESELSSEGFESSEDNGAFDEADLFESGDFELEAMHALDNAFGPDESQEHAALSRAPREVFEDPRERTDPNIRPYALRREESSDLHLTLSEEAQAIAGISLDSVAEVAGVPLPDDDTERIVRSRKTVEAMPVARQVDWGEQREGPQMATQPPAAAHPKTDDPQLASPNYRLPPRSRLLAVAAACLLLGLGVGFIQTEGPVDKRTEEVRKAESHLIEGNRAFEAGELERALGHYRSALALQPNYPEAVYARAVVLARQKRFEEAAKAYREYVDLAPDGLYANAVRKELRVYKAEK